ETRLLLGRLLRLGRAGKRGTWRHCPRALGRRLEDAMKRLSNVLKALPRGRRASRADVGSDESLLTTEATVAVICSHRARRNDQWRRIDKATAPHSMELPVCGYPSRSFSARYQGEPSDPTPFLP